MKYEEGMETRDDIVIHGECPHHGRVQAQGKRWVGGGPEPMWLCPECRTQLTNVEIDKISLPCRICNFFEGQDLGGGHWVCLRCLKIWERVNMIMTAIGKDHETPSDQR